MHDDLLAAAALLERLAAQLRDAARHGYAQGFADGLVEAQRRLAGESRQSYDRGYRAGYNRACDEVTASEAQAALGLAA